MSKNSKLQRTMFLRKNLPKNIFMFFGFLVAETMIFLISGHIHWAPALILLNVLSFLLLFGGIFQVSYYTLAMAYSIGIFALSFFYYFLQGVLNTTLNSDQQGYGLGLSQPIGIVIAILALAFFIRIFYKMYKSVNFRTHFEEVLSSKHYNIESKLYYIDCIDKEPELEWRFFSKKDKDGLSLGELIAGALIIISTLLHPAFILITTDNHPSFMGHLLIVMSLPIAIAFFYAAMVSYVRYRSYNYVEKNLNTKLKPAILNIEQSS